MEKNSNDTGIQIVYSCRMLLHKGRGIMLFMFSITTSFVLSSGDQFFGKFFFYDINCFPISTQRIFYLLYFIRNHYQSCVPNKCPVGFFYISEIEYRGFHVRKKKQNNSVSTILYVQYTNTWLDMHYTKMASLHMIYMYILIYIYRKERFFFNGLELGLSRFQKKFRSGQVIKFLVRFQVFRFGSTFKLSSFFVTSKVYFFFMFSL